MVTLTYDKKRKAKRPRAESGREWESISTSRDLPEKINCRSRLTCPTHSKRPKRDQNWGGFFMRGFGTGEK